MPTAFTESYLKQEGGQEGKGGGGAESASIEGFVDVFEKQPSEEKTRYVHSYQEAVDDCSKELLAFLERSYEHLDFHNKRHSLEVASRIRTDLSAIKEIAPDLVSDEEIEEASLRALSHDLIMQAVRGPDPFSGQIKRIKLRGGKEGDVTKLLSENKTLSQLNLVESSRENLSAALGNIEELTIREVSLEPQDETFVSGNELASAALFYNTISRFRYSEDFTDEDGVSHKKGEQVFKTTFDEVIEDIAVTCPDFDFVKGHDERFPDRLGLRVYQKHLSPKATLRQISLAVADLRGPCGASSFEDYYSTSDAEFRESNAPWIEEALKDGTDKVSLSKRAEIVSSALAWTRGSRDFVLWQKKVFEGILDTNELFQRRPEVKDYFAGTYNRFDENADRALERYENLKERFGHLAKVDEAYSEEGSAQFKEFLEELGYEID